MKTLTFSLSPTPPFRLDLTALALQRRPINKIDSWNGDTYSRVLVIGEVPVLVQVTQTGTERSPRLHIRAQAKHLPRNAKVSITGSLRKLLGLRADMKGFHQFAQSDRRLKILAERFAGLRPPRFPFVFEAMVNGIACQQLSLHVGLTLLNRLTVRAGLAVELPAETLHAFPGPGDISRLRMQTLRRLGFSANKGTALKSVSSLIVSDRLDPEALADCGNDEAVQRLLALRGIGRWTAEYVLLRGLGRIDIFPADDVGARNNLARWLNIEKPLDYAGVKQVVEKWRPWSGLIYFHLLLDRLTAAGALNAEGAGKFAGWKQ
jgi:DNA-3-methyladenine glycosylase II